MTLDALEARLRTILPAEYQDNYEEVKPVSMGSAGLKFADDGTVAWDEIWGSFCDLAMAGGPPHKGKLLEPGTPAEIAAEPDRYREVVAEICRGITLVTDLAAEPAQQGWVRVACTGFGMAGWLTRAITMENISVRCDAAAIELPSGPAYRLEKEIKNVITSIAKTCHYWSDHMWFAQQRDISNLFARLSVESPLIQPAQEYNPSLAERIHAATGLLPSSHRYAGWLGFECSAVRPAVWMMRALVASNVLARREETVLFVPVNSATDPGGETVIKSISRVHGFARDKNLL